MGWSKVECAERLNILDYLVYSASFSCAPHAIFRSFTQRDRTIFHSGDLCRRLLRGFTDASITTCTPLTRRLAQTILSSFSFFSSWANWAALFLSFFSSWADWARYRRSLCRARLWYQSALRLQLSACESAMISRFQSQNCCSNLSIFLAGTQWDHSRAGAKQAGRAGVEQGRQEAGRQGRRGAGRQGRAGIEQGRQGRHGAGRAGMEQTSQ